MITRKSFLRAALAAGAFPFIGCQTGRSGSKVRLACVGIGQQAWNDIQQFQKTGLCEIAALCDTDLDGPQCVEALKAFPNAPRFCDFRKMLDVMDGRIDAVAVMNPDFSHFPALMAAMKRGLAVFAEKPLAHTFEECELLMQAAAKYGVVTQMGNQGHSGENYFQMRDYVAKGIIDPAKVTKIVTHMNNPRRWHKWNGKVSAFPKGEELPKGLDWDTWLGTANFHAYSKDYVQGEWRSWYDFGNGCLGDWGAHTMDANHEFLELGLPTEIKIRDVKGWNPFVFPMQDTLTFTFPKTAKRGAITLEWYEGLTNLPKLPKGYKYLAWGGEIPAAKGSTADEAQTLIPGKAIYLSDGTVWEGQSHAAKLLKVGDFGYQPEFERPGSNHYANFLLGVMGLEKTRSPFSVAAPLSEVFCLGCIAQRLNRSFLFDPATKQVIGDEEANALLKGTKGTPRKGWEEFYRV